MKNNYSIIGAGIIGLSVGWQLARKGFGVQIFERDTAGRSASWYAAGMLAPRSEAGFEESQLLAFGLESLRLYPQFLSELEHDSGISVNLEKRGTLMVGLDRDDTERLRRLYAFRKNLGLPISWLSGTEAREIEPMLSPRVASAMWIPDDVNIDNRALVDALRIAFQKCGGVLHENTPIDFVNIVDEEIKSVRTSTGEFETENVILAAGCWSKSIPGIPESIAPPVRPVKGQIMTLRMDKTCTLSHIIRAPEVYLVPKENGRLIVGASAEEMGFDTTTTAGHIKELLENAWEVVPSVYDLAIEEVSAGLRPGSRDNEPIIGPTEIAGLHFATGHFRSGILFAPATAYGLAEYFTTGIMPESLIHFQPSRFNKQHISETVA